MIEFFRDVLSGPLYVIVSILAIVLIMAIIGFIMERKKLEKEEQERIAVIDNHNIVTPIEPVTVYEEQATSVTDNMQIPVSVSDLSSPEVTSISTESTVFVPKVEPVTVSDDVDFSTPNKEMVTNPNEEVFVASNPEVVTVSNVEPAVEPSQEVPSVIVFEDPDQKNQ